MALTKNDLIESLKKQGVELTGKETVAELKALISANAEHVAEAPEGDIPAPEEVQEEDESDGKDEITIKYRDHVGQVASRTFSKVVHGKEFKLLADEFKKTNAARIVT